MLPQNHQYVLHHFPDLAVKYQRCVARDTLWLVWVYITICQVSSYRVVQHVTQWSQKTKYIEKQKDRYFECTKGLQVAVNNVSHTSKMDSVGKNWLY